MSGKPEEALPAVADRKFLEIDVDNFDERMKAAKEHRVPLSPRAVEILETVKPLGKNWLFPSDRGGRLSGMAMAMLLRRMKVDATVHGFRSGFR